MKARLLPPNSKLGWTPYAWLIYLPTFVLEPAVRHASSAHWTLVIAATLVFLASYFRGYWLRDRQLLPIIALQAALGFGFSVVNTGSFIFFVYAASFAAQLQRPREAARVILALTALAGAAAWLSHAAMLSWVAALVLPPLIGGVNLHFAQVARAEAKLRLAQDEVEHLATVAERERIARDLHDVLGHTLSLIVLKSELASKLAERDPARAVREIRDVEQVARTALTEVREAIRGYRVATLDDEIARGRSLLAAAGIRGEFSTRVMPMDHAREAALAFALREMLTNVARHSRAGICRVVVEHAGDACTLEVMDDGCGGLAPEGSGLQGMRERIEAMGGTVVRTGVGGTRLVITMPLDGAPSGDAAAPRIVVVR